MKKFSEGDHKILLQIFIQQALESALHCSPSEDQCLQQRTRETRVPALVGIIFLGDRGQGTKKPKIIIK